MKSRKIELKVVVIHENKDPRKFIPAKIYTLKVDSMNLRIFLRSKQAISNRYYGKTKEFIGETGLTIDDKKPSFNSRENWMKFFWKEIFFKKDYVGAKADKLFKSYLKTGLS